MKVQAIGVQRLTGISSKTGKPYDFARLLVLKPIDTRASPEMTVVGYGYESTGLDLSNEAVSRAAGLIFPLELDVTTDTEVVGRGFKTVITSFKPAVVLKAA